MGGVNGYYAVHCDHSPLDAEMKLMGQSRFGLAWPRPWG